MASPEPYVIVVTLQLVSFPLTAHRGNAILSRASSVRKMEVLFTFTPTSTAAQHLQLRAEYRESSPAGGWGWLDPV